MKDYWIAYIIEIKTAALPCHGINTRIMSFLLIVSDFRLFLLILGHFIDHFYNSFL